jgi:hypothetical protein
VSEKMPSRLRPTIASRRGTVSRPSMNWVP